MPNAPPTQTPQQIAQIAGQGPPGTGASTVVNVNADGSGGRQASPYVTLPNQDVVCSMDRGPVVVTLPTLLAGGAQSASIQVDDAAPPNAVNTLTIKAAAGTTLAQPYPNNGVAVTQIVLNSTAYAGQKLTWKNAGSSDGRYLVQ